MGISSSSWCGGLFTPREPRVFMGGINKVGKTSILYYLKCNETCTELKPLPTIGFNLETLTDASLNIQVWEFGGYQRGREHMYPMFMEGMDAFIYVVDGQDTTDMCTRQNDLRAFLALVKDPLAPVLIFFNKQDVDDAQSVQELLEMYRLLDVSEKGLGLPLAGRAWSIQPCSAATGDGVREGLDWLRNQLVVRKRVR